MKILAINPGHNSTIGYFIDGTCECLFHEEKFNNIKSYNGFPRLAFDYVVNKYSLRNSNNVDYILIQGHEQFFSITKNDNSNNYQSHVYRLMIKTKKIIDKVDFNIGYSFNAKFIIASIRKLILFGVIAPKSRNQLVDYISEEIPISKGKILFTDHHISHAFTPFYFYNLQNLHSDLLLITMDGMGDNSFSKIYQYRHKENAVELLTDNSYTASLGLLYSSLTKYLGMKMGEHEYKVMGLAAYVSDPKYYEEIYSKLAKLVWINEETLQFESKFNLQVADIYFQKYLAYKRFDNLAAALQKLIENLVLQYIKLAIKKTGIHYVAVSGGVFMNVKLNQRIMNLPEVKRIYFMPSCGDDSHPIGLAGQFYYEHNISTNKINTMFLGHHYLDREIEQYLHDYKGACKYTVQYFEDIELEIARLLERFEIVGRFSGTSEWGARSLCNRGILANASDLQTFYEINDLIKMRDFWMPFAPTILEEWAERYIEDWDLYKQKCHESMKFMIVTVNSTSLAQKHLRAAIHQKDKTMRPQIVNEEDNPKLYKLLKHFERLTGKGGFLNTSLNVHGYPLASTIDAALFTFEHSKLQYLAIENYLLAKKES